jgi:DNA polymerase-3 subunit gamma/tau
MLPEKYRPKTVRGLFGNQELKNTIESLLKIKANFPHCILLTGNSGCGKTTVGRIISKELGCSDTDFNEYDAADLNGVDFTRKLRLNVHYQPKKGEVAVHLIDECHRMSTPAQEVLLKTLEEPPPHAYFILCTTDPNKLLKTVRSRSTLLQVRPLNEVQGIRLLKRIAKREGADVPDTELLEKIIEVNEGHPRACINSLGAILYLPKEKQTLEAITVGSGNESEIIELAQNLYKNKPWKSISQTLSNYKEQGVDPESVRRVVLGYMSSIVLRKLDEKALMIIDEFTEPYYNTGFAGLVLSCAACYSD